MTTFERLLSEMPRIAQAVNGFHDPVAAHRALDALLESLGVPPRAITLADDADAPANPLGTMATVPVRSVTAG